MNASKQFNELALEFLNKMIKTYPDEHKIKEYYIMLSLMKETDKPVEMFMSSLEPYGIQIMTKNEIFFKDDQYVNKAESISGKLGLIKYWDNTPQETKNAIWSYIQNLYALGMKCTGKIDDFKLILAESTKILQKN